ncbi:MAG: hypothetical protein J6J60_10230 [Clostridia bacterium]|nr:hypothetical protein [Clostridia bacterium]
MFDNWKYSDELLKFTVEEVYKYDKDLLGVNTRNDVAERFAKFYCELANMKYKIY